MPFFFEVGILCEQVRWRVAFVGVVRSGGNGFVNGGFEIVVDLPFGFDQLMAVLTQEKGRVVRGHDRDALVIEPFAAVAHGAGSAAVEVLKGHLTQADDDFGLDEAYFFLKVDVSTSLAFIQGRRAIALGTAFDDVRDVDVVTGKTDAPKSLVEELPRRPDQGNAVFIFHAARSFADEHEW